MANDILVKVGADISDFSRKMAESNKALSNFGKANAETFDAFKKTGAMITGVGTLLAGGLGIAVKTSANFEQAMSNVKAISGAVGKDFDSLRDKAIEMGAETAFSASQSADAMANLAQMGWKTDEILAGIEHTLNLAAAGGLELADAAMIAANTINQFGLDAGEAERVADVFAKTAASAGTDVYEMAHAMQYAGANAAAAGLDIEQTAALIGILGDAGISGSKAGTALNAMLRDLKKNAEDGALAVGKQTISLYDANGAMRPLPDVIADVIRATEGMSDAQRDAALSNLFGEQAMVAFNSIASQGADSVNNLAKELYGAGGAAAEMADVQMDNLNGAITALSSAFEGVQIALGSALIPYIRKATELLKGLADWFNGLSDGAKKSIAIITAIASALMLITGPALLLIGFIPQIIAGFTAIKTVLLAFTGPIGWTIAAIGAIVAGLTVAYKRSEKFANVVNTAWQKMADIASKVFDFLRNIVVNFYNDLTSFVGGQLSKIRDFWTKYGDMITDAVKNVWSFISTVIKLAMDFILYITKKVWPVVEQVFAGAWQNIKIILSTAVDIILNIVKIFGALFTGNWSELWQSVKDIVVNIWDGILGVLKNVFERAVNVFDMVFGGLFNKAKDIFDSLKEFVSGIWTNISNTTVNTWQSITSKVLTIVNPFIDTVVEIFTNLRNNISSIFEGIKNIASGAWNLIKNVILGPVLLIVNLVTGDFEELRDNAKAIFENIKDALASIWEGIKGIFSGYLDVIKTVVGTAFELIKTVIISSLNTARDSVKMAWEFISGIFTTNVKRARETVSNGFLRMVESVKNRMARIRDTIKSIWRSSIDFLRGINLRQVGRDIIQGMINGIADMAKKAVDAVKNIGKNITSGIKGILGIKSPSRVLMEIGKWTSLGLADGIEDYAYLVDKASDMLAESAIPDVKSIDMSYATPDGITARSLAGAVSGTVDVNSRDSALANAIKSLEGRLINLEITLDGRQVGRAVEPYVSEIQDRHSDIIKKYG